MTKDDASKLQFFVNDKNVLDALALYVELRTVQLKEQLTSAPDMNEVLKLQGAIEELKRTRHLRDLVNSLKD